MYIYVDAKMRGWMLLDFYYGRIGIWHLGFGSGETNRGWGILTVMQRESALTVGDACGVLCMICMYWVDASNG